MVSSAKLGHEKITTWQSELEEIRLELGRKMETLTLGQGLELLLNGKEAKDSSAGKLNGSS